MISCLIIVFFFIFLFFVISRYTGKERWLNIGWILSYVVLSFTVMFFNVSFVIRSYLIMSTIALWAFRLSIQTYLCVRSDNEYENGFEVKFSKNIARAMGISPSLIRGVWVLLFSLPAVYVHYSALDEKLGAFDLVGALLWFAGFVIEIISDVQLITFKSKLENKEKIMNGGLWKYSRHPNWFGSLVQWWGIFFVALSLPGAGWTVISPLTMTISAIWSSYTNDSESSLEKGKEEELHRRTTSALFPWFPQKTMTDRVK